MNAIKCFTLLSFVLFFVACKHEKPFSIEIPELNQSILHVPARIITNSPGHHWFGYYDKLQFDPSGRYVLSMETSFEGRSPQESDTIKIGMTDLQNNDKWIELGTSCAWSWQQGCMLQFIPGSANEIIWNDRENGHFVSHIMNIITREKRTLPFPVYALSPDGIHAVTTDFERIQHTRPGYGYAGITDPNNDVKAPDNAGIYLCNLTDGSKNLIITYGQMSKRPSEVEDPSNAEKEIRTNWFNHLLFNTDGSRFIFLHRWRSEFKKEVGGFATLMYTSDLEGSDIRLMDPSNYTSHFIWRDRNHVAAWTKQASHGNGFYVFEDGNPAATYVLSQENMPVNGHNTYLPGNNWILNDTYPDKNRFQHVYLYHIDTDKRVPLGDFFLAPEYKGERRCDTHPRSNPQGNTVCIDCPVEGKGRQLILLDISKIINQEIFSERK